MGTISGSNFGMGTILKGARFWILNFVLFMHFNLLLQLLNTYSILKVHFLHDFALKTIGGGTFIKKRGHDFDEKYW